MRRGVINLILCLEEPRLWLHALLFGQPGWRLCLALLGLNVCATPCVCLTGKVEACPKCSTESSRDRGGP